MKVLWCWRCRCDVPMLEDEEWAVIVAAHRASSDGAGEGLAVIERERLRRGLPAPLPLGADSSATQRQLRHLSAGYELFTGAPEPNPGNVWHHVVSQYGPPCGRCGKPLRHAGASHCAACGAARDRAPANA